MRAGGGGGAMGGGGDGGGGGATGAGGGGGAMGGGGGGGATGGGGGATGAGSYGGGGGATGEGGGGGAMGGGGDRGGGGATGAGGGGGTMVAGHHEGNEEPLFREEKPLSRRSRLFVGNLPYNMNEEELRSLFTPFGGVDKVFTCFGRSFGFVHLVSILTILFSKQNFCCGPLIVSPHTRSGNLALNGVLCL
uniref:RRM domain-containing protein n=1 Tax=Eptatretus burgeri TaxID=7764 RepID=A0A8C4QQX9_EPTBU